MVCICEDNGTLIGASPSCQAIHYGIEKTPQLLYFKHGVPGLFDGDMGDFPAIYNWLVRQKRSAGIQHVSDAILENVIDSFDYVAAIFTGRTFDGGHTRMTSAKFLVFGPTLPLALILSWIRTFE